MGKIFERLKKNRDNKGMSFVEVLCAVAILGLVSGVIGGVITVSTRTYRKGISETSVQQEAQLAANTISNVVKDAYTVVYAAASGGNYYKDGVELVDDSGAAVTNGNDYTELSLTTNSSTQYSFFHYPSDGRLLYGEYDVSTGSAVLQGNQELMASNITAFTADTSDFADNRTITLEMTVKDDSTGREIPMTYTMKSRNESGTGVAYAAVTPIAQVYAEDVVLVPGETYDIPITVYGTTNVPDVNENTGSSGLTINSVTTDYVSVTLDTADSLSVDYYTLYITTQETGDDGITPVGTATCNVYVRQVKNVAVSVSSDVSATDNGLLEEKDAIYTFAAAVTGNNLAKQVATDYDTYYMTAQAVTWSWTLTANGTTTAYTSGNAADSGFSWQDAGGYVKFVSCYEVTTYPQIKFTALQDLPSDFSLTVTATSNHADGYNKANHADNNDYTYQRSGSDYADVSGEKTLTSRDAKVSGGFEITLEPNETGTVSLRTLGGTTDMDLVISGNTDAATAASYDVSTDEVTIKLGNDEKGSGASEDTVTGNPYTFVIYVYPQGKANVASSLLTTVIVHVRRIDVMSIMVFDNWLSEDGKSALATPTYDFRGRINVSNGVTDDTLLTYLYDDNTVVPETLSTKISWALKNKSGTIVKSDSVVCMATVGTTSNSLSNIYDGTTGKAVSKISNYDTDYYSFQGIKHPRVQTDSDGNYYLKQMPEIDVSFGKSGADTVTGLPDGWTFTVTMEMLHPLGTYTYSGSRGTTATNKTGIAYGTASDSVTLTGEVGISAAKDVVYAEPGQGTEDSKDDSDEELIIPIIAEGAVYKMSVSISGNSSSATRISNYPETDVDRYGNVNPYLASNATSADNTRTWYLGMKIGTDEVGSNKDGLITVTVTAYNAKDAAIASADFTIAIRRVNKVSVKAAGASSLSRLNAEGQEITLEAYPTGYGTDGIEYYAMQTDDDGNTCRWETENHGEYKTPYTMEWRMYYDGKEKALSEWTEYFSNISTAVSESSHKATTTFTLLQELPSGAKIRAYSLHSYGSYDNLGDSIDDSSVSGTTKYNKSGKDYGGVYGEISLGATYEVASGFQRADDYTFATFDSVRSTYFTQDAYGSVQRSFFRYKETGDSWDSSNMKWHMVDTNSETQAFFSGNYGSLLFLPTQEYQLEIVNVVYGTASDGNKYIYWPLDESLLEAGCGWKEAGYQLWDGSWGGWGTSYADDYQTMLDTSSDAFRYYTIPESEVYFEPYTNQYVSANYQKTIDGTTQTVGSVSSPIELTGYNMYFYVTLAPTYFNIQKTQAYFTATIDKLNDSGEWEEMLTLTNNGSMSESTYGWFMQVSVPNFSIYHVADTTTGTYRIRSTVTGMTWMSVSGDMFSPTYTGYKIDSLPIYDLDTEAGIMYIKLN
ncbi:MAG: hypothetical protein LUE96_09420 [Lachnospiraceae bacterium]|nr:hypothetical protein [Lachnospiraceae bacterium]